MGRIDLCESQLKDIDKKFKKIEKTNTDVQLLETITGVGQMTSIACIAAVGDVNI